jgi:hypothetical protein
VTLIFCRGTHVHKFIALNDMLKMQHQFKGFLELGFTLVQPFRLKLVPNWAPRGAGYIYRFYEDLMTIFWRTYVDDQDIQVHTISETVFGESDMTQAGALSLITYIWRVSEVSVWIVRSRKWPALDGWRVTWRRRRIFLCDENSLHYFSQTPSDPLRHELFREPQANI